MRVADLSFEVFLIWISRHQRLVMMAGRDGDRVEHFVVLFLSVHFFELHQPATSGVIIVVVRYVENFCVKSNVLFKFELFRIEAEVFQLCEN